MQFPLFKERSKRYFALNAYVKKHAPSETKESIIQALENQGYVPEEISQAFFSYEAETTDLISGLRNRWNVFMALFGVIVCIVVMIYTFTTGKEYDSSLLRSCIILVMGILGGYLVKKGGSRIFIVIFPLLLLGLIGIGIVLLPLFFVMVR